MEQGLKGGLRIMSPSILVLSRSCNLPTSMSTSANKAHRRCFGSGARRPSPPPGGPSTIRGIPTYIIFPAAGVTLTIAYGYYSFLDEAPLTKRKRLLATSPAWERQMGDEQYRQMMRQNRGQILPHDHRASITVRRVGGRIARAADKFAAEHGLEKDLKGSTSSQPTFTVIRSDMANAFVLPNNHVFVLTGLFKYARDEDELAAVLGHEQAHCLARHAGERVSGSFLVSIIARFVLLLDPTGVLYTLFVPAATLLHELPHSRDAEIEADHIGLYLAAEACYDPRAAKRVFARMKAEDADGDATAASRSPPEFVSTHPSYDTRLSKFDDWMPDALSQFNADGGYKCRHIRQEMKKVRILAAQDAARREGNKNGNR